MRDIDPSFNELVKGILEVRSSTIVQHYILSYCSLGFSLNVVLDLLRDAQHKSENRMNKTVFSVFVYMAMCSVGARWWIDCVPFPGIPSSHMHP